MNPAFFQQLADILATERLDAYRQDGVPEVTTLARYLWNMALCEALYSPLQLAEIALRNSLHRSLTTLNSTDQWYNTITSSDTWQQEQLDEARETLKDNGKPITPGRMVAELHFGFWTSFFNKFHAQTGLGHKLARLGFPNAPVWQKNMKTLGARWQSIRTLRNRVFHHERIIHWKDLEDQHTNLLEVIGWTSTGLKEMAEALDRFTPIRQRGLDPWITKIRQHWP